MRRIFRIKVMMTAVLLLLMMAAMSGQQRLAAQEAGESILPDMGNVLDGADGTSVSGMGQAGGKQGGVMELTLEGAMDLACGQSVDAAVALNQLKSAYWQFRTYKAERLPELVFNGTLPTFNNNYNSYQNADGSYGYVRSNWLGLSGELSVTQNIPFTGGTVSLSTGLDMTRQLGTGAYNEFMSVPVALTLTQPLFSVNTFRWDKKIEPVRYAESRAAYSEDMEEVKMNTITYFFNYILAVENLKIAEQNLENADKLYSIAQERRKIGQISETELMQLSLSALQAKADVTERRSNLNGTMFNLRAFLGLSEQDTIVAVLPEAIPLPELDYQDVLSRALANSSFAQNILRRKLEADYDVATAKGQRYQVDLNVTVGYSGVNRELAMAYNDIRDQEVVSIGLSIPILDWGKRKGQVKVAESNRDVVRSQLRQEELDFNQNIFLLTEQFNNQAGQLELARESDRVASARYQSSVESFLIGRMSVLELNDARDAKDLARQDYVQQLYYYWYYYYNIRSVTLWDYATGTPIKADVDALLAEEK
jgi:outer membrane protein TolC